MTRDKDLKRRLLETYDHTGGRLLVLGVGLLLVLVVAVGASAFATVYAIRNPPNPPILGIIGPASLTGVLFALSSVLGSVARILEARNRNPAMLGDHRDGDEAHAGPQPTLEAATANLKN